MGALPRLTLSVGLGLSTSTDGPNVLHWRDALFAARPPAQWTELRIGARRGGVTGFGWGLELHAGATTVAKGNLVAGERELLARLSPVAVLDYRLPHPDMYLWREGGIDLALTGRVDVTGGLRQLSVADVHRLVPLVRPAAMLGPRVSFDFGPVAVVVDAWLGARIGAAVAGGGVTLVGQLDR